MFVNQTIRLNSGLNAILHNEKVVPIYKGNLPLLAMLAMLVGLSRESRVRRGSVRATFVSCFPFTCPWVR